MPRIHPHGMRSYTCITSSFLWQCPGCRCGVCVGNSSSYFIRRKSYQDLVWMSSCMNSIYDLFLIKICVRDSFVQTLWRHALDSRLTSISIKKRMKKLFPSAPSPLVLPTTSTLTNMSSYRFISLGASSRRRCPHILYPLPKKNCTK